MNIGAQELILIFAVALILLGPKRLPEVARFLARISREIQRAIDEIKKGISGNDRFEG